jgi:hypothetical protein
MYPHRIRLRGPWVCEPLAHLVQQPNGDVVEIARPLPPACRMNMPCHWCDGGLGNFAGRVRFRRRFGLPRSLDSFERVWLTFGGAEASAAVCLNGHALGRHETANTPFEFLVTDLLHDRNELVVEVTSISGGGGLWGEVALEIRCAAFLRNVQLRGEMEGEEARLLVAGAVGGSTELPLELYAILDRYTVGYKALASGATSFEVVSDPLTKERWQSIAGEGRRFHDVRVELVQGGVTWYTFEQAFEFQSSEIV